MDRRQFLTAGAAAASLLAASEIVLNPLETSPAFAWPNGCIDVLPKSPIKRMAWTIDDGFSQSSVASYLKLLEDHDDLRMTMFVMPRSSAWRNLARPISELAATGRLQLGNHTMTHANLLKLDAAGIKRELQRCTRFIEDTFNINPGTYFRPPFGYIDDRVIRIASDLGYKTPVLWYGSTGSDARITPAKVWTMCQTWMNDRRIVIDHANSDRTVLNFDRIRTLLKTRGLHTVTLKDAFAHN